MTAGDTTLQWTADFTAFKKVYYQGQSIELVRNYVGYRSLPHAGPVYIGVMEDGSGADTLILASQNLRLEPLV
ncbi:hypothetical protein OC835_007600 [Tilletia horrida]|nr:hypothetical protein OC835_007600 [Tilletia horrida]